MNKEKQFITSLLLLTIARSMYYDFEQTKRTKLAISSINREIYKLLGQYNLDSVKGSIITRLNKVWLDSIVGVNTLEIAPEFIVATVFKHFGKKCSNRYCFKNKLVDFLAKRNSTNFLNKVIENINNEFLIDIAPIEQVKVFKSTKMELIINTRVDIPDVDESRVIAQLNRSLKSNDFVLLGYLTKFGGKDAVAFMIPNFIVWVEAISKNKDFRILNFVNLYTEFKYYSIRSTLNVEENGKVSFAISNIDKSNLRLVTLENGHIISKKINETDPFKDENIVYFDGKEFINRTKSILPFDTGDKRYNLDYKANFKGQLIYRYIKGNKLISGYSDDNNYYHTSKFFEGRFIINNPYRPKQKIVTERLIIAEPLLNIINIIKE